MPREPGYCHHKPTGQAYIRINGRITYLGKYNSPESRERYAAIKAEWLANRHAAKFAPTSSGRTIAEVCLAYLDHAEGYYGQTTELANIRGAIRPLAELFAKLPARQFGPLQFEAVRNSWIGKPGGYRTLSF